MRYWRSQRELNILQHSRAQIFCRWVLFCFHFSESAEPILTWIIKVWFNKNINSYSKKATRTKQRQVTTQISRAFMPDALVTELDVVIRRLVSTTSGTSTTDSLARPASTGRMNVTQERQTRRPELAIWNWSTLSNVTGRQIVGNYVGCRLSGDAHFEPRHGEVSESSKINLRLWQRVDLCDVIMNY